MARLYGRAGRFTAAFGGPRPGQTHAAQLVVQNPAAERKLGEEREAAGALAARAAQLRERLAAQV